MSMYLVPARVASRSGLHSARLEIDSLYNIERSLEVLDSPHCTMASPSTLKRRASSSPDHVDKRIRLSPSHQDVSGETPSRIAVFGSAEIFLHILSFLPVDDIINVERVSRYWRRMAEDGSLWRKMYLGKSSDGGSHAICRADLI